MLRGMKKRKRCHLKISAAVAVASFVLCSHENVLGVGYSAWCEARSVWHPVLMIFSAVYFYGACLVV